MSTVDGFHVGNEVVKYNYEKLENYNTPEFSTSATYAVGDYVMYDGKLYKCKTAITTASAWDVSKWDLAILSDDVSNLSRQLNVERGYSNSSISRINGTLYAKNYIDFASLENDEALASFNVSVRDTSKLTIESKTSQCQAFIPLLLPAGSYDIQIVFSVPDTTTNVRLFDSTKSQQIQALSSGTKYTITNDVETLYYIRLYIFYQGKTLTITNAYAYNQNEPMELLYGKIGTAQFTEDVKNFFKTANDIFADSEQGVSSTGVTVVKDGNDVNITTTDSSAYTSWTAKCKVGRKYTIYYNVNGTYTDDNYSFQFRLVDGSWKKTIQTISQTVGVPSSGSITFTVENGEAGYLAVNIPNVTGQNITGKIYLYDVTDFTTQQINSIDFSSVGSTKTFLFTEGDNEWEDKKVVFYGDSITQTDYPERVQSKMGFTLVKNAVGGSRFTYYDTDSLSSDSRIQQVPTDADVVCIMGGTNDWQWSEIEEELAYNNGFDRSKFKGAVAYTVQKMQAQCPNAIIYLCTNIGGRGDANPSVIQPLPAIAPSGAGIGNTPLKIRDATIEVANALNIAVIDTWSCGINGFNRSVCIADSVHPTAIGCQKIADYIVDYLT